MNKFRFELQGVLDIKLKLENQAKMNFAAAQQALNEEEAKKKALEDRCEAYRERLAVSVNGTLDLREIARLEDAIDIIKESIAQQDLACRRAAKQVELARGRLNTAIRERKTLEKLKEKSFEEYVTEYNAAERKEVDELVSYRHSRA